MTTSPRLALPAGATLVRCGTGRLQVGSTPPIRLPDTPGTAQVLRQANGIANAAELAEVAERDGARNGPALVAELVARRALVAVDHGPAALPPLLVHHDAASRLFAAAVGAASGRRGTSITIVAGIGEPDRRSIRELCERGVVHLPVAFLQQRVRLGPLVRPGASPCLDCYDAWRAQSDPAWGVAALHFRNGASWGGGLPADLSLAAAARVVALLHDRRPGRVVTAGPGVGAATGEDVPFELTCACHQLAA